MHPVFEIEALRTIVVAAELGSFARAAAQLGRSQSAASMQLKRLEEQAGHSLFRRNGRGLVPTEAGEALLAYARRIVTMHDEAATALGSATAARPAIRLGLPQDFFEDVMPDALAAYSRLCPNAHVEVRAGRNYALQDDVQSGQIDIALAFVRPGRNVAGERITAMPLRWYGNADAARALDGSSPRLPLVLFDHPCLFRQTALQALDHAGIGWRLALTTPSLPGVWAALRFGLGITVRTSHGLPDGLMRLDGLPDLPTLDLCMFVGSNLSSGAREFVDVLRSATIERVISSATPLERS